MNDFFPCFLLMAAMTLPGLRGLAAPADSKPSAKQEGNSIVWLRTHGLSEEEFIQASKEPGTVIIDASDRETYKLLHIAGAVHLSVPEMTAESLGKILPNKNARILIYQNNNYRAREKQLAPGYLAGKGRAFTNELGDPLVGSWSGDDEVTCAALRQHGYTNIYGLATYIRIDRSKLPLVASMSSAYLDQPVTLSLATASTKP